MRSKLPIALVLGALAGVATALYVLKPPALPEGVSHSEGKVLIGGPFSLVDQTGARRTEKDFLGRPMLVFFGFTNCPDVCPSGLQTLAVALNGLGDKSKGLASVFISVDPERDTPEALAAYIRSFHSDIQGLTGTPEEVQAAAKSYRVYYKKVPDATNPKNYSVDHSAFFYLMDGKGQYVKHFPHTVDAEKLSAAIAALL